MLQIEIISHGRGPAAYGVRTSAGRFAGVVVERNDGTARAYFNMDATKGSIRRFPNAQTAIAFIADRRIKKERSL